MQDKDFLCFKILKEHLVKKLQEGYPDIADDISLWKGKEIRNFQQDLEENVNGRISEKSFYTHFKSDSGNLPRIDILNLLCEYLGYENWLNFKSYYQKAYNKWKYGWVALGVVVLFIVLFIASVFFQPKRHSITVIDAYSNETIDPERLKIIQLYNDQSPKEIDEVDDSIYTFYTNSSEVKFIVEAPYFHADTIIRKISFFSQYEYIRLLPNDYALIIHSLSTAENEDWTRRRSQLSAMISDNAKIFQFNSSGNIAIEMYNKNEFINKLTIPINSLKNIDIIDIKYENELISELRFVQEKGENND